MNQPQTIYETLAALDQPLQLKPAPPSTGRIHVGFSGGLDSTVLLHWFAAQFPERVHAVHIHHGLQPAADSWAEHCAAICAESGLDFSVIKVEVDRRSSAGPEAAARQVRYAAFRGLMSAGDCLATAHHRDDQAETLLLRLLRGTGIDGLAGMRAHVDLSPGTLWRPLLAFSRTELRRYAEIHQLSWIDDPQNLDPRYTRSWLRAEVLPALQQRFPQLKNRLARTASLAAEASDLLGELAAIDLANAVRGDALSIETLLSLSVPRRHNLLRFWLRTQGFEVPPADQLPRIADEVLRATLDASPQFGWPGCDLRRYRDRLFAMSPLLDVPQAWSATWTSGNELRLPANGDRDHDANVDWLEAAQPPAQALTVRFPREGERFKPAGGDHHRTLKNLFQEAGVPPWIRSRTPVIECKGAIAAVAGLGATEFWLQHRQALIGSLHWRHRLRGAASPTAL